MSRIMPDDFVKTKEEENFDVQRQLQFQRDNLCSQFWSKEKREKKESPTDESPNQLSDCSSNNN